jgi:hypothetical protein
MMFITAWQTHTKLDRGSDHLQVCKAFFASDYSVFTSLYLDAPRMSPFLMDALAGRLQRRGAAAMVSAYAPSLPLEFASLQLGLESVEQVHM